MWKILNVYEKLCKECKVKAVFYTNSAVLHARNHSFKYFRVQKQYSEEDPNSDVTRLLQTKQFWTELLFLAVVWLCILPRTHYFLFTSTQQLPDLASPKRISYLLSSSKPKGQLLGPCSCMRLPAFLAKIVIFNSLELAVPHQCSRNGSQLL